MNTELLTQLEEYFDRFADVDDGQPNEAMRLLVNVRQLKVESAALLAKWRAERAETDYECGRVDALKDCADAVERLLNQPRPLPHGV